MSDREKRAQLQPVEPTEPDPVLDRITDPVAREVYRKKLELGIERFPFVAPIVDDDSDDDEFEADW